MSEHEAAAATAARLPPSASAAARLLRHRWQAGSVIDALPAELRPADRAAGYAVQAQLPLAASQSVAGRKIAAISLAGQAHIGVSGPLAGRLLGQPGERPGGAAALAAARPERA